MIKELHKIFGDDFNFKKGEINKNLYSYQFKFDEGEYLKLIFTISKLQHEFPGLNTGYLVYNFCLPNEVYVWLETSIRFERMLKLKKLK